MKSLSQKTCTPCEGGTAPLTMTQVVDLLKEVPLWGIEEHEVQKISRTFEFKNYYQTIAFVNAIAWIAHQENHHPDLEVGYQKCTVKYTTHAIKGLSWNDFICAAKVDVLCINK